LPLDENSKPIKEKPVSLLLICTPMLHQQGIRRHHQKTNKLLQRHEKGPTFLNRLSQRKDHKILPTIYF
jgi:hypothetical protein